MNDPLDYEARKKGAEREAWPLWLRLSAIIVILGFGLIGAVVAYFFCYTQSLGPYGP